MQYSEIRSQLAQYAVQASITAPDALSRAQWKSGRANFAHPSCFSTITHAVIIILT